MQRETRSFNFSQIRRCPPRERSAIYVWGQPLQKGEGQVIPSRILLSQADPRAREDGKHPDSDTTPIYLSPQKSLCDFTHTKKKKMVSDLKAHLCSISTKAYKANNFKWNQYQYLQIFSA